MRVTSRNASLATVSHELRTPLNAILRWIHLLKLGAPSTLAAPSRRLNATLALKPALSKTSSTTDFHSKTAYMRAWNRNPTPFAWTKPAAAIIKSTPPDAAAHLDDGALVGHAHQRALQLGRRRRLVESLEELEHLRRHLVDEGLAVGGVAAGDARAADLLRRVDEVPLGR